MASEARISSQSGTAYTGSGNTKYNLKSYTYPENLFSNKLEFGNTWVMININVLEQSGSYKPDQTVELSPEEKGKRWTQADSRDQSVAGATASAAASGAVVGGVTSVLASKFGGGSTKTASVEAGKGAVRGGAVAGATVGVPLIVAGTAKRETKRLASAIQLPMPNNIMAPYSVEWGTDDTAVLDMMLRAPGVLAGAGGAKGLADAAAKLALSAESSVGSGGISAASGLAANPKKEMIFSGVDFRNFTMDYRFYPKNASESRYIKNIIDLLKFHMYPEYKSNQRFTYIYPSEFDITFFIGDGKENPWVNRISTSVLTNMTVNYTPDGVWAVHADGSPVVIQLSLTFKELSLITKENLINPADSGESDVKPNY